MKDADKAEVKVPRVWFFPKTRMKRAIKDAAMDGGGGPILKYSIGDDTEVYLDIIPKPVGQYNRKFGQWYPRFTLNRSDEVLRQTVAPYAVIE